MLVVRRRRGRYNSKSTNQSSIFASKETMTDAEIRSKLGQLTDPELGISFDRLGLIRSVLTTSDAIKIDVQLPTPAYPSASALVT